MIQKLPRCFYTKYPAIFRLFMEKGTQSGVEEGVNGDAGGTKAVK